MSRGSATLNPRPGPVSPPASPELVIYSDGSCLGNPGPGGWAVRLKYADGRLRELGGHCPDTTNNRMELYAAIRGLEAAGPAGSIHLVTDSEYLRRGITSWIHQWKQRGWRTAAKKPVLNQDLWQALDRLNSNRVHWRHTRGHAGDPDNQRCDDLAQAFSRGARPELLDTR
jgi:ribonuclease HI